MCLLNHITLGWNDNAGNEEETKSVEFSISAEDPDAPMVVGYADPATGARLAFTREPPADMAALIAALEGPGPAAARD